MPIDPATNGSILELRGILAGGAFAEAFELLRVHESPPTEWDRYRLDEHTPLRARLTDEAGRELVKGWAGPASTTFDDLRRRGPFETPAQLVRLLLPLPPDGGHAHTDAPRVVELFSGDLLVWRETVAPARPRLEVVAEATDQVLQVRWHTEATGSAHVLLQQHDGGGRRSIARSVDGRSLLVPAEDLPGGLVAAVVRVVSGLREATALSEVFELPPRASALSMHLERSQVPAGQPVTAKAVLTDAWGRSSTPEGARWSVDDELVAHGAVVVLEASVGGHRVRVEHDDAAAAEETLQVT